MSLPPGDPYTLERAAIRRAFDCAAATYDEAAALHGEVRERLLERLDYVKLEPAIVVDLGAATGAATRHLADRYPQACVLAVDFAEGMLAHLRRSAAPDRDTPGVCADAVALPFKSASVDLVFCNLTLAWCNEPAQLLTECRRILRPGGLLNLASFGPDTLYEMRSAWADVDDASHVHRFLDMHDLGDAIVRAGLSEPVLDTEYFTLTYKTLRGIMRELKQAGVANATVGRPRGLTGRGKLRKLRDAYERFREGDRLPLTYEVVYAQAWGSASGMSVKSGHNEARIPVSMVGRRRRSPG